MRLINSSKLNGFHKWQWWPFKNRNKTSSQCLVDAIDISENVTDPLLVTLAHWLTHSGWYNYYWLVLHLLSTPMWSLIVLLTNLRQSHTLGELYFQRSYNWKSPSHQNWDWQLGKLHWNRNLNLICDQIAHEAKLSMG